MSHNEKAIALLVRQDHPVVKLLLPGGTLLIDRTAAITRLKSNDYEICWAGPRVKWLRLKGSVSRWQSGWRTDGGSAVIEPGLDWGRPA